MLGKILVFMPFSVVVMHQGVSWNYLAAAVCILAAVFFIFCAKADGLGGKGAD